MRIALTLFTTLALAVLTAAAALPADSLLADLEQATYVTVTDLEAQIPHGQFMIHDGVVAMFPGMDRRTAGLFTGDMTVTVDKLPQGEGVLDILHELNGGKKVVELDVEEAYISASIDSAMKLLPSGKIRTMRKWADLSPAEQEQFRSIYLQSYSDAWVEQQAPTQMGSNWAGGAADAASALKVRDPRGKEVFVAAWGNNLYYPSPGAAASAGAEQKAGKSSSDQWRYDYRVNEDASEVSITDYYRGITLYQSPWAREEGDLDKNVTYSGIEYSYVFNPGAPAEGGSSADATSTPGKLQAKIDAHFTVAQASKKLGLVSQPWVEFQKVELESKPLKFTRSGTGSSPWMLFVDGDFQPGTDYTLHMEAECDVPETFSGVGYAGVYRFDTSALWPGEDKPVNIEIVASLPDGQWSFVASNGAVLSEHPLEEFELPATFAGQPHASAAVARWDESTRSQMLVATLFPSRELPTPWGKMQVYAPSELISSVEQFDYINAVGDIIDYYSSLWGKRPADVQPLYVIPGESGVQAFEDAGLVFILGGDRPGIPLVAHEVAHLWWGNDVATPRWFYEGMANYSASKYVEHYYSAGGPGAGQGDPLTYRRYIINFGLGYELPVSLERRDELDDSAAIYHNSAGFLLTCDARLPYGLDGILGRICDVATGAPPIGQVELRGLFADASEMLGPLWDEYVEQGIIEHKDVDDDSYREFVFTPGREKYVQMLHWLSPARRKAGLGDFEGALYCANRALKFRSEPKDFLYIADLTLKASRPDEAMERAMALLERDDIDAATRVKCVYIQAKVYRLRNDPVNEKAALEVVVKDGPPAGLMMEVQAAQERLKAL